MVLPLAPLLKSAGPALQAAKGLAGKQVQAIQGQAQQALGEIKAFSQGAAELSIAGIGKVSQAITGYVARLKELTLSYQNLVQSNEDFRKSIIQTQTALASNFRVYDAFGNEIEDVADKIASTEDTIRNALLKLEKETRELTGVTSAQTTEAFNIVLSEGGAVLQNQLGEYDSTIDASIAVTKGLVAALGSLGMPLQQARQEFRAFVQGDLKNPDAQIIKQLGIDEASFRRAESEGRLAEFIVKSFEPATEANKLASQSIEGAFSNIQDVSEVAGRTLGDGITSALVDALIYVQDFLFSNEDALYEWAEVVGDDLGDSVRGLIELAKELQPTLESILGTVGTVVKVGAGALSTLVSGLNIVVDKLQEFQNFIDQGVIGILLKLKKETNVDFTPYVELGVFEKVEAGVNGWVDVFQRAWGGITGGSQASQVALDSYQETVFQLSQEIRRYGKLREEALAAGDDAAADKYLQLLVDTGVALEAAQEASKDYTTLGSEQEAQLKATNEQVEGLVDILSELGASGDVDLSGRKLQEFGSVAEELGRQADSARRQIELMLESGAQNTQIFTTQVDALRKTIGQQADLGIISASEAMAELVELSQLAETTVETRLELEKQIVDLVEKEFELEKAKLKTQQQAIDTALSTGEISDSEAKYQKVLAERESVLVDLQIAQEKLANTQFSERSAELLNEEIAQLQDKLAQLDGEAIEAEIADALAKAEINTRKLNAQIDLLSARLQRDIKQGGQGLFEFNADLSRALTEVEIQSNQQAIDVLKQRIQTQQQVVDKAVGEQKVKYQQELDNLLIQLEQQLAQADSLQAQITSLAVQGINERIQRERQRVQLSRTLQDSELAEQQAYLAQYTDQFGTSQLEISRIQSEQALERAQEDQKFAKQRLEQLKQVEVPTDLQARLELLEQIRQAEQEIADANLARINAIRVLNAQVLQERLNGLDTEQRYLQENNQLEDRRDEIAQRRIQQQIQSIGLQIQAAQTAVKLANAQANLQKTLLNIDISRVDQAKSLTSELRTNLELGARERAVIRKRLRELGISGSLDRDFAAQKLKLVKEQVEQEKKASEAKYQAEKQLLVLQNLQASLQAKMQVAQAKADLRREKAALIQLDIDRKRAELIEDPEERARQLAIIDEQVGLQKEAIDIAEEGVTLAEQGAEATAAGGEAELQVLDLNRQAELAQQEQEGGERIFQAERELARAQDRPFGTESPFGARRAPRLRIEDAIGTGATGAGVSGADSAAALSGSPTFNVTNNFNAPLANAQLARGLGL